MTTPRKDDDVDRKSLVLNWARVVVALGVCVLGAFLFWGVWYGTPVAAAFTRVAGTSRVETALEAARFWLTPPQYVVETQTRAGKLMLAAAQCAVVHDAPLLFTSPDPKQQRQVDATINDWRRIETPKSVAPAEVSTIKNQLDLAQAIDPTLPRLITIRNQQDVTKCLPKRRLTDIARLSTLEVPNPLIRLSRVPTQSTLEHVVVFAAAIEPGHPPDVAVGLALAAQMARANREQVSLVVVPPYLESDAALETKLQRQHEQVTGGVVLGQTPTVPEETRALLRQLVTSRDGHGVLAQLQENLGSVGSLIGALLALVGLTAATRAAAPIVIELRERTEQRKRDEQPEGSKPGPVKSPVTPGKHISQSINTILIIIKKGRATVKKSDWRVGLGDDQEVTIWLRSGRQVMGIIKDQIPSNTREATVFRIKEAPLPPSGVSSSPVAAPPGPEGKCVLVSVKEIEKIDINAPKPEAAKASPTTP